MLRDSFWILGYNSITKLWEHKAVPGSGNGGILGGRDPGVTLAALAHPGLTSSAATRFVAAALPIADWRLPI